MSDWQERLDAVGSLVTSPFVLFLIVLAVAAVVAARK
jgi:hypothetical protein